jgi:3-oxoacyl-[acyl-carrier-protein] synthase III
LPLTIRPRVPVRAKISALGTWTPPRLLTNTDLEKMVETSDEWITSRVGIKERHIVEPGMATSHMAVEAAKRCLAERGIDPTDVEVIIVGTVTPDMLFPATACLVQDRLGAKGAWGFDLSAACSGFVYALQMGSKLVESGAQKKVLVIGADTMSSIIDYTDRATCVLFGDGSGACALFMPGGGSLHPPSHETVDKKMHYVHQDGQAVYKFAVRKMVEATTTVLERNGVTGADLDCFIAHQANKRIILGTSERLGLPQDKVIINIDRFGNTTCGTIPLAMETARQEDKLKKGDLVLIASVGAGFTVGAALMRWEI